MKKVIIFSVLVLILAVHVKAAENVKIKLPDGVYMYDSEVQRQKDESDRVGFGKFFVVYNKKIFSSKEFVKKFGITRLNTLFGGNKKNKILCGGEVVGTKFNCKFEIDEIIDKEDATFDCDESYVIKNFKQGPIFSMPSIYLGGLGSATKCIAVPEEYKEVKKKVYTTISQEEVDKIAKLVKEKLFDQVKNRKEVTQYEIMEAELYEEKLDLLDKISHRNDKLYLGIYRYVFKKVEGFTYEYEIVFSAKKDHVHVITSQYDDATLLDHAISIRGMLDVDSCGVDELIIEKLYSDPDAVTTILVIYKQKADGNWTQIKEIK